MRMWTQTMGSATSRAWRGRGGKGWRRWTSERARAASGTRGQRALERESCREQGRTEGNRGDSE